MPEPRTDENQTPNSLEEDERRDDVYDPSEVEASRAREQGLGAGQRDLDRQQTPERPDIRPEGDVRKLDPQDPPRRY